MLTEELQIYFVYHIQNIFGAFRFLLRGGTFVQFPFARKRNLNNFLSIIYIAP